MAIKKQWKLHPHFTDAEVSRKFADVNNNIAWLKDMLVVNPKGSAGFPHYQRELNKEELRLADLRAALVERGLLL